MNRTLRLAKETLAELSSEELAGVAAAQGLPTPACPTIPLWYCVSSDAAAR